MKIPSLVIYGKIHRDEWEIKSMLYVDKFQHLPVEKCHLTVNIAWLIKQPETGEST